MAQPSWNAPLSPQNARRALPLSKASTDRRRWAMHGNARSCGAATAAGPTMARRASLPWHPTTAHYATLPVATRQSSPTCAILIRARSTASLDTAKCTAVHTRVPAAPAISASRDLHPRRPSHHRRLHTLHATHHHRRQHHRLHHHRHRHTRRGPRRLHPRPCTPSSATAWTSSSRRAPHKSASHARRPRHKYQHKHRRLQPTTLPTRILIRRPTVLAPPFHRIPDRRRHRCNLSRRAQLVLWLVTSPLACSHAYWCCSLRGGSGASRHTGPRPSAPLTPISTMSVPPVMLMMMMAWRTSRMRRRRTWETAASIEFGPNRMIGRRCNRRLGPWAWRRSWIEL